MPAIILASGSRSIEEVVMSLFSGAGQPAVTRDALALPEGQRLTRPAVDLEIIIPARDEERRLADTISSTVDYLADQPWSSSVLVVDNGSVDRTVSVVDAIARGTRVPVRVLGCRAPGKGAAVRRGVLTSAGRYVGFMDADMATPISTLDVVMPLLEQGYAAIVASRRAMGSRYVVKQDVSRRLGGALFRVVARRVVSGVQDTQCGFKFFDGDGDGDGDVVRDVLSRHRTIDGFAFDLSLLRALKSEGRTVVELPVDWSDGAFSTVSRVDAARAVADAARLIAPRWA